MLKTALLTQLKRYFEGESTSSNFTQHIESRPIPSTATFLNPRWKHRAWQNRHNVTSVQARVEGLVKSAVEAEEAELLNLTGEDLCSADEDHNANEVDPFQDAFLTDDEVDEDQRSRHSTTGENLNEVESYVKLEIATPQTNPLVWWKDHEVNLPHLAKSAMKFLAIPAASVTSEREFKVAKFASRFRYRLKPANLERLLFLKYNLEALSFPLLHGMESPPPDFTPPNGALRF